MSHHLLLLQRNGDLSRRATVRHIDLLIDAVHDEDVRRVGAESRPDSVVTLHVVFMRVTLLEVLRIIEGAAVLCAGWVVAHPRGVCGGLDVQVALMLVFDDEGLEVTVEGDVNLAEGRLVRDERLVGAEDGVAGNLGEELRSYHIVTLRRVGMDTLPQGVRFDDGEARLGPKATDDGRGEVV